MIAARLACLLPLAGFAAAPAASIASAMMTRYTPAQLGGVTAVLRYAVARPDRDQTRFVFLSAPSPRGLPQEVPVEQASGDEIRLSDEVGADCTLAHVEIVTGAHPLVLSAVRVFSPNLADNDLSAPAAMDIQAYRPARGEEPGDPAITLRAAGKPVRSAPLCRAGDVRRAMLATLSPAR